MLTTKPHLDDSAIVAASLHWARRLHACGHGRGAELDDTHHDLIAHVLRRRSAFDPDRGSSRTYADRVARAGALNLRRDAGAARRGASWTRVCDTDVEALPETQGGVDPALVLDVRRVLAGLRDDDRRVCSVLMLLPVAPAAEQLGLTRAALRRRIARLRMTFEAEGLRTYLEAA